MPHFAFSLQLEKIGAKVLLRIDIKEVLQYVTTMYMEVILVFLPIFLFPFSLLKKAS